MSRLVPSAIETLGNRHVLAVAMGREHTIVLTDEGVVLSFGYGGFGALGHGDKETQLAPKVIEALRGRRVVAISAGAQQSLVFTDDVLTRGWEKRQHTLDAGATALVRMHEQLGARGNCGGPKRMRSAAAGGPPRHLS